MPGKILILNGTSSSGKTTLIKALQEQLAEPYLNAGLDKFLWMLPMRYLDRPLWDEVLGRATQAGALGHALTSAMHHAWATLAQHGQNVVADHVLVEPQWVAECAQVLGDLPAYLIGVRCPLAVVEQRERDRKDRTLGQASAQFNLIHAHGVYDFEVDTSLHQPAECAQQIQAYLHSGAAPTALRQLRKN